jgi:hypothetical protein
MMCHLTKQVGGAGVPRPPVRFDQINGGTPTGMDRPMGADGLRLILPLGGHRVVVT